jgi:putative RecB family exonuclease
VIDLEGVPVRGFIDWVGYNDRGNLIVRDTKTGRTPGGPDQLATYALAVEAITGSVVEVGDFFMTRTGKPTVPYSLTRVVKTQLIEDFGKMDTGVKAGVFPPKPSAEICRFCSVSNACSYKIG